MNFNICPKLKVEVINHSAVLTLSNPAANVFDEESLSALPKLIDKLNAEKSIYTLIVTGEGEKFFSAGADLKMFKDGNKEYARKVSVIFGRAFESLYSFRGLSIAAINGYAMGGGLECALACDLRIAEEHSQMALPEAAVGLLPCGHGTQALPHLVGEGWAKKMILCGERLNATQALEIKLVEEVVPKGQAKARALELATKLESQSPSSVTACKKLIQASRHHAPYTNLALEREYFVDLFDTYDCKEGVTAFLEKRKAAWKNA